MTPAFTVCLPHKRNKGNDAALKVALSCLFDNTVSDFKLIIDAAKDEPLYQRINAMFEQATTDMIVYLASDCFVSPGWDLPLLEAWQPDTIANGVLVEPGAIGVHHWNLHKDFGRTPEQFNRAVFEAWVADNPPFPDGWGWYCSYAISRQAFLDAGGFKTDETPDFQGFTGADELFFDNWLKAGKKIVRTRSYVCHLQRWSNEDEQRAEKRKAQE